METLEQLYVTVRSLVDSAVRRNLAGGILLSGIDTSILATAASKFTKQNAYTCALEGAPAPDLPYAKLMADRIGLKHSIHVFGEEELFEVIPKTVKVMKRFDPMEIRNGVTIYIGFRFAREAGETALMTGDAGDELMAGYSWLQNMDKEKLDQQLQVMWSTMEFSSIPLSRALGMEVKIPYLDPEFKSFAMKLDPKYKIREENGKKWGKWIMRKAFENILPKEVAWRSKDPIEVGSGTTTLPKFFSSRILDEEFNDKKAKYSEEDGVSIRDKEQLTYYEAYRSIFGKPKPVDPKARTCPQCHTNVPEKATFCRTCGAYPI